MTREQFKEARERLGLTQRQLADKWSVNIITVSRWETGARAVNPVAAYCITLMAEMETI